MSLVRRDTATRFVVSRQVGPVTISTDTNTDGTLFDLSAYPGHKVMAICSVGDRTDGTFTFNVQASADTTTWANLDPFDGSMAAVSAADTTREGGFTPLDPYLRIRVTSASVSSGADVAAFLVVVPPGS